MSPDEPVKRVLLVIADIGGYTRFMTSNKMSLLHSQIVISELTQAILDAACAPLAVSKLEGDAVFMYAVIDEGWDVQRETVRRSLLGFFEAFTQRAVELKDSNLCRDDCKGCSEVDRLRLKIVVHSGEALFHRIGRFDELSGPDVIVIHRLLKNSVAVSEYVLFTESAARDLDLNAEVETILGAERYDELGEIGTRVWYALEGDRRNAEARSVRDYSSLGFKIKNEWGKAVKLLKFKLRPGLLPKFGNLPIE